MKTSLDCFPCFVRQAGSAARMVSADPAVHERIVREVLRRASQADLTQSPPLFGRSMHQWVRELTGQADPYLAVKQESNRLALALLPAWRERLRTAANPRLTAVKMAIAGELVFDRLLLELLPREKITVVVKGGPEFRRRFARADLIIAKGQANFESLDGRGQNIFSLFKVKCSVVARHIGQAVGNLILHRDVG